ncbi:MAG: zf-TFIIB domain-containing protein [Burkholderiales bacterium]|nr:zf-TFIIB domain-containing protein [Burkholderiales bacterium]
MPATSASGPTNERSLDCGNCRAPMQRLALAGHYGSSVELDVCGSCDLVWFDGTETARLNGPGLLELIGMMAAAYDLPYQPLTAATRCPRCSGKLKTVHNQSRWGRSVQLQCVKRDGAYQSFAEFLEEKGLLRPMSRLDRARLLQDRGRIDCVNCGAAIDKADERCPYCTSVPSLLDVARLARALDPEAMVGPHEIHKTGAQQQAMQCAACGAALPPGETMSCAQCGATLAIPSLREAYAAVEKLAPVLKANAERPPAEVVKRRLEAIQADLPRRREWVAGMEQEARERRGHGKPIEWATWVERGPGLGRAAVILAAVWLLWRFWR